MVESEAMTTPPTSDWVPLTEAGLIQTIGPLFVCKKPESFFVGLRVEHRHCNPAGICHGGTLMTFADVCMGKSVIEGRGLPVSMLPTINLSVDFLAPAPLGSWLEGNSRILRATGSLAFVDVLIMSSDKIVVRASATFKIDAGSKVAK